MLWWMTDAISNRSNESSLRPHQRCVVYIPLITHSYRTGYDISSTTPQKFQYCQLVEYLTPTVRYTLIYISQWTEITLQKLLLDGKRNYLSRWTSFLLACGQPPNTVIWFWLKTELVKIMWITEKNSIWSMPMVFKRGKSCRYSLVHNHVHFMHTVTISKRSPFPELTKKGSRNCNKVSIYKCVCNAYVCAFYNHK